MGILEAGGHQGCGVNVLRLGGRGCEGTGMAGRVVGIMVGDLMMPQVLYFLHSGLL